MKCCMNAYLCGWFEYADILASIYLHILQSAKYPEHLTQCTSLRGFKKWTPKNTNSVMIYSPLFCFIPAFLSSAEHKIRCFKERYCPNDIDFQHPGEKKTFFSKYVICSREQQEGE